MSVSWPATLPPMRFIATEYNETAPDNRVVSEMDEGPAKMRRQGTAKPRRLAGTFLFTGPQLEIFEGFYQQDLEDGTLRFEHYRPRSNSLVEMRFVGDPYEITVYDVNLDTWRVDVEVEVLP